MAIVSAVASGNELMETLKQILEKEEIKEVLTKEGFPVRIEVPVSWAFEGVITFQLYN